MLLLVILGLCYLTYSKGAVLSPAHGCTAPSVPQICCSQCRPLSCPCHPGMAIGGLMTPRWTILLRGPASSQASWGRAVRPGKQGLSGVCMAVS